MRELILSQNRIAFLNPIILLDLASLEYLDLSHNLLSSLEKEWGELAPLKRLDVSFNRVQNVAVELGRLYNIESCVLHNNPIANIAQELVAATDNSVILYLRDIAPRMWNWLDVCCGRGFDL